MKKLLLLLVLLGGAFALALSQASAQNRLPPRPPIFLNNNASLYTFPNPNFGKPSQLPFAFVAVAHEDCRLYNNGAKLMPKHRLLAAECIQAQQNQGILPIDPLNPIDPFPIDPFNPFPPVFQGINYRRQPAPMPTPPIYATPYGYTGNYASYNPGVPQTSTMTTTYGSSATAVPPKAYAGFGTFRESTYGGFQGVTGTGSLVTTFGAGFDRSFTSLSEKEE